MIINLYIALYLIYVFDNSIMSMFYVYKFMTKKITSDTFLWSILVSSN